MQTTSSTHHRLSPRGIRTTLTISIQLTLLTLLTATMATIYAWIISINASSLHLIHLLTQLLLRVHPQRLLRQVHQNPQSPAN
ncbi:unnamed protein product [Caenorhabditis brenneri]